MSNFWKILLLILLNVVVSASVTYGVLYYWDNIRNNDKPIQLITVSSDPSGTVPDVQTGITLLTEGEPSPETIISDEPEAVPTEEPESEPTAEPTPVIRGAKVEIAIIRNPGVFESEALRVVSNSDEVVSLEGWTLEDANGNILKFPNIQLLRKGIFVEVYSRPGHSTPFEIYWDRQAAVWQSGETAVIRDHFGQIQATYRIP